MNENVTISRSESQTAQRLRDLSLACIRGQLAGAELALHDWYKEADCPSEAHVLLAGLLSRRKKYDDAQAILNRVERARPVSDPSVMMVMTSVYTLLDMTDAAARQLRRLHTQFGHLPQIALWIHGMQLTGSKHLPEQSDAVISQLAKELALQPGLLISLTKAMKIAPVEQHIEALRHAGNLMIHRIALNIDLETELCQAMASLALLAEDESDARRWAHRGLKVNPMAAHLAIILSQVEDQKSLGPEARDVLAKVSQLHPTYPDVHAALIRREFFDGDTQSARMRLSNWLKKDPLNPTAISLRKEIAA